MLIAVIGSPASASTWAFNAVRAMLAVARPGALSLYAETGNELLRNIPLGCKDVVIKAHSVDADLLKLLETGEARIFMTDRDPHDSTVSQTDRFDMPPADILHQLTQAYASMAMVLTTIAPMRLRYEDGFFKDQRTLPRMAEWIGIDIPDSAFAEIFASLDVKMVGSRLQSWTEQLAVAGAPPVPFAERHDHATQLHPTHIGDGKSGKGRERLSPERLQVISDCLSGFGLDDQWRGRTIKWSSTLFKFFDSREPRDPERLEMPGEDRLLVYGPYLYLPAGYWRIVPLIRVEYANLPLQILADIFTGRRGLVQLRTFTLPACNVNRIALEFEHIDHLDPLEVRFSSVRDGNQVDVLFSGVELSWLGPLDPQPGLSAREVHDRGILSC